MNLLFAVFLLMMHPVRETLAEIQCNDQTNRLEVALRLSVEDERELLGVRFESLVSDEVRLREAVLDTLCSRMRFGSRNLVETQRLSETQRRELRSRYHWVGRETEGAHVWWYFEFERGELPKDEIYVRSELLTPSQSHADHPTHRHDHATSISTIVVGPAGQVKRPSLVLTPRNLTGNLPEAIGPSKQAAK